MKLTLGGYILSECQTHIIEIPDKMMAHICNPSYLKAEIGGRQV
jgi:hypothetical protein